CEFHSNQEAQISESLGRKPVSAHARIQAQRGGLFPDLVQFNPRQELRPETLQRVDPLQSHSENFMTPEPDPGGYSLSVGSFMTTTDQGNQLGPEGVFQTCCQRQSQVVQELVLALG